MLRHFFLCFFFVTFVCASANGNSNDREGSKLPITVEGRVFHDVNNNGSFDVDEKGISEVVVSNGLEIVTTDFEGRYHLNTIPQEGSFIFITMPSGYRGRDKFYQKIASCEHPIADFGLISDPVSRSSIFSFVQTTDIHIDGQESLYTFRQDLAEINTLKESPAFLIGTGDLVNFGNQACYDEFLVAVQTYPKRFYNVIGNHDAPVDLYESYLGPSFYSFDYGQVHFVILNCLEPSRYAQWLKKDLDRQPKDKIIIVAQHYAPDKNLLDLLSSYNTRAFLNGHWHSNKAFYYGKILVLSTPSLRFGGIDCSSRGYRVITVHDGKIQTQCRWGGVSDLSKKKEGVIIGDLYTLKWKTVLNEGTGITAPLVDDGRIYVGIQDDDNALNCGVVCLDNREGKRIWKVKADGSINGKPVLSNGILCAVSVIGTVYGWDAASGELRWTYSLGNPWERWVFNSPSVMKERIFCGVASYFVCLDAKTGKIIWRAPVIGTDWISCRSNPVIDESAIYLNVNWSGGLTAINQKDGAIIWNEKEVFGTTHSSPVIQDDALFDMADNQLYRLDKRNGKKCWQMTLEGGWTVSTPVVKDSVLVVGSPDGKVFGIKTTTGEKMWSFQTGASIGSFSPYIRNGSQVMASPVIVNDWVYVGANDGAFYILSLMTGKVLWQYQTNLPILSSPSVMNNQLYYSDCKETVYAFAKSECIESRK